VTTQTQSTGATPTPTTAVITVTDVGDCVYHGLYELAAGCRRCLDLQEQIAGNLAAGRRRRIAGGVR
jgi:hypothetical protein